MRCMQWVCSCFAHDCLCVWEQLLTFMDMCSFSFVPLMLNVSFGALFLKQVYFHLLILFNWRLGVGMHEINVLISCWWVRSFNFPAIKCIRCSLNWENCLSAISLTLDCQVLYFFALISLGCYLLYSALMFNIVFFNSRTAIAGAIIGLLLVFFTIQRIWIVLGRCLFFLRLEEEYWFS